MLCRVNALLRSMPPGQCRKNTQLPLCAAQPVQHANSSCSTVHSSCGTVYLMVTTGVTPVPRITGCALRADSKSPCQ